MFDIGFAELVIIAVVSLVVIGPERLPDAVRTVAKMLGRAKRTYGNLRRDLEREIGADEIRRELYNEAILEELKQTRQELNESINWQDDNPSSAAKTPDAGTDPNAAEMQDSRYHTGESSSAPSAPSASSAPQSPSATKD